MKTTTKKEQTLRILVTSINVPAPIGAPPYTNTTTTTSIRVERRNVWQRTTIGRFLAMPNGSGRALPDNASAAFLDAVDAVA